MSSKYCNRNHRQSHEIFSHVISALYSEGASKQELAFLFDVDPEIICKYVDEIGIRPVEKDKLYEKILILKRRGLSPHEISAVLEIPLGTATNYSVITSDNQNSEQDNQDINAFRDILTSVRIIRDTLLVPFSIADTSDKINLLLKKGLTGVEIAKVLRITKQSVSNWITKNDEK